ncbi:hypothetical protein GOBAR_AA28673 [Gossypium barbadense]|uniref:Uncharacterized protein n=3 Tax=Gossypium TaxID=3633 RepID=A0A2P5WLQ5_GOSBA|nr:hypothetical protein GOBAR_AA28673 [Gossypium barbadense]
MAVPTAPTMVFDLVFDSRFFFAKKINILFDESNYLLWRQQHKGVLSMKDFLIKVKSYCDSLASYGEINSEHEHVIAILNGFSPDFLFGVMLMFHGDTSKLLAISTEDESKKKRGDTKDHPLGQWFLNFSEADELLQLVAARQQVQAHIAKLRRQISLTDGQNQQFKPL